MPIRPENRKRYPKDWKDISHRIRFKRAKGRCECSGECNIDHGEENDSFGICVPGYTGYPDERCSAHHGKSHHVTGSQVLLTVAHLDHQPENCEDTNLKAMCQRCHNRLDARMRRAGIKARARLNRAIGELI
jgi:hypothetical protein